MSVPFIGEIKMFGGTFAPRNWAFCDGSLIAISQNQALFAILGTNFGGDGRTTFGLPDLRGRVPMSPGRHPGSGIDFRMGQTGGQETTTIAVAEVPAHTHSGAAHTHPMPDHAHTPNANSAADSESPTNNYWASVSSGEQGFSGSSDTTMTATSIGPGGDRLCRDARRRDPRNAATSRQEAALGSAPRAPRSSHPVSAEYLRTGDQRA